LWKEGHGKIGVEGGCGAPNGEVENGKIFNKAVSWGFSLKKRRVGP